MYHSSVAVHLRSSNDAECELVSTGKEPWAHSFWILLLTRLVCSVSLLPFTEEKKEAKTVRHPVVTRKNLCLCSEVSAPGSVFYRGTMTRLSQTSLSPNPPPKITCQNGCKFLLKSSVYCFHCLLPLKQPALQHFMASLQEVHPESLEIWNVLAANGTPKLHFCFTDILQDICIYPDLSIGQTPNIFLWD